MLPTLVSVATFLCVVDAILSKTKLPGQYNQIFQKWCANFWNYSKKRLQWRSRWGLVLHSTFQYRKVTHYVVQRTRPAVFYLSCSCPSFLPGPVLQGRRALVNRPQFISPSSWWLKVGEVLLTKLRPGWRQVVYSCIMQLCRQ